MQLVVSDLYEVIDLLSDDVLPQLQKLSKRVCDVEKWDSMYGHMKMTYGPKIIEEQLASSMDDFVEDLDPEECSVEDVFSAVVLVAFTAFEAWAGDVAAKYFGAIHSICAILFLDLDSLLEISVNKEFREASLKIAG